MATSPPPPPYASLPNPKKRPSISSTISSQSAAKRRQLHPLRQTSFPAIPSAIDSAISHSARSETGSAFSATSSRVPGAGTGRGRGRPPKNRPTPTSAQDPNGENASQTGRSRTGGNITNNKAKSVISARSGGRGNTAGPNAGGGGDDSDAADEDQDSEDEAEIEVGIDEAKREQEEDRTRQERERRLASTLEGEAEHRYSLYRSLKIDKKIVRRLINAVMSQSANEKVINAVQFTSKLFVGAIIELARDVQREWAVAYDETRKVEKLWRVKELARLKAKKEARASAAAAAAGGGASGGGAATIPPSISAPVDQQSICDTRDIARLEKEVREETYIPNPHRGGLLPDHLREALRRYRADGQGFGAGEQGSAHPLLGVVGGVAGRLGMGSGGKRLFR